MCQNNLQIMCQGYMAPVSSLKPWDLIMSDLKLWNAVWAEKRSPALFFAYWNASHVKCSDVYFRQPTKLSTPKCNWKSSSDDMMVIVKTLRHWQLSLQSFCFYGGMLMGWWWLFLWFSGEIISIQGAFPPAVEPSGSDGLQQPLEDNG